VITVTISGIREARQYFATLKDGADALGKMVILVGFSKVYAFGQETGRYRSGRLARRAGGAWMLRTGLARVQPDITGELVGAVEKGPGAVLSAGLKLGYRIEAIAKPLTPVRSGELRRDLHTVAGRRGDA
jgi:hypothetical protein